MEVGEGRGGGSEVIESAVVGGEVNDVSGDFVVVVGVEILEGGLADIGDSARDGGTGVEREGAGNVSVESGGLRHLEGADFVVESGKDGIAEGAEGAVGGITGLESGETVEGESGAVSGVFGVPEGENFVVGEERGVGGLVGVLEGGSWVEERGDGYGGGLVLEREFGEEASILLNPLEEAAGGIGEGGEDFGV